MYTVFYEKNSALWYVGISLYAGAIIFLFISLVSYNATDSSWLYVVSDSGTITNQGGFLGAQVAAFCFYFFGGASFLLLVPLLWVGWIFCTKRSIKSEWERLCACLYLACGGAALLTTYGIDLSWSPYPGGMMGLLFTQVLTYYFDSIGCILFLYTTFCASFVLLFRWSFIFLVRYGIEVVQAIGLLIQKYHVIGKCVYAILTCLHCIFIRMPLFFMRFIYSLFDGSAFENTGLMYPEEDEFEQTSVIHDFVLPASLNYCVLRLSRNNKAPGKFKSVYAPVILSLSSKSNTNVIDEQNEYINPIKDLEIKEQIPVLSIIKKKSHYVLPHITIFIAEKNVKDDHNVEKELQDRAYVLQDKLKRFGVHGKVVAIKCGPVVTLFEYQPDVDTKLSKIIVLEDDLAMALQAMSIRIIAPIPGRSVVGFEVANTTRHDVLFSQVITQTAYTQFVGSLPLVLGKDTIGDVVVVDLARMPHLLIAGSTGSGKSVALNAILISLLCKLSPDELKLILIDPKRLEFAAFTDIPHLLYPIVTNPAHAAPVLRWVVQEMEDRYEKMAQCGARNIADYNERILRYIHPSHKALEDTQDERKINGSEQFENTGPLPYIVVVIDELADLMITAGRDIEDLITRITQMARAAGIHMIVATQRPSVDVITGLIKANFPSRISFRVASRIDSRTILDTMGADRLLGRGDMLFLDASNSQLRRVHGAYVSDKEIEQVADHIRRQRKVEYLDMHQATSLQGKDILSADDILYKDVRLFLDEIDEISISLLQRKFRIGYNRSARIIDILESQGLIMPQDGSKTRKVIR
jgi:DNA segregation ATPase FtsK/SpoIIIE-like protein